MSGGWEWGRSQAIPSRGEIWWVRVDKRRPAIVVQTDHVREARVRSFLVVPLTSRLHLEGLPGNVRLSTKATGLSKTSVANVFDIQKVIVSDFIERAGVLPTGDRKALDEGLRLALQI